MDPIRRLPRQARWGVPIGAMAAVGLVIAGSAIAGAQSGAPALPARSTAQLLAAVDAPAALPSAMTAVIQETASLGLPDLPGTSDPTSGLSLLTGTHTFKIWYDGPTRVRIAVPVTLGETDLRRLGSNVWLWNSKTSQATHYVLPARAGTQMPAAAVPPAAAIGTPQQVARRILAAVGTTTTVGLQQNVTVAGQAAYQLSLAPKDSRSLIGQIRIAIDAQNSMPLQVQIFARGATSPAFQLGFTSLSFATPAASNFAFTPPPGAKVRTIKAAGGGALLPGLIGLPGMPGLHANFSVTGAAPPQGVVVRSGVVVQGAKQVALPRNGAPAQSRVIFRAGPGKTLPKAVLQKLRANFLKNLPTSLTKAQRAAALKSFDQGIGSGRLRGISVGTSLPGRWIAFAGPSGPARLQVPVGAPRVMGKGWLSVAVLPAGGTAGMLGVLQGTATAVHGSWGSGRLLRTTLLSVLITSNGRVLIGAVQPSVLYADAAQLR